MYAGVGARKYPEPICCGPFFRQFAHVDWGKFDVRHATRQRFGGLAHQIQAGGPQEQEVTGTVFCTTAVVDDATKDLEESGGSVDFIDDDQHTRLRAEKRVGILESSAVRSPLEIEIQCP